ncbi:MAG: hypothetical protein HRU19_21805 [Pseudobacteriovorax sp.]|nr:hypothetical protein [Pseudobacteriovorax sp.]
MTVKFSIFSLTIGLCLSCGIDETIPEIASDLEARDQESYQLPEDNFIPQLGLVVTSGTVTVQRNTFYKVSTAQSSTLSENQKCSLREGETLRFTSIGSEQAGHIEINLRQKPAGCVFRNGFFFKDHITYSVDEPFEYSIKSKRRTWFKASLEDSTQLDRSELCQVEADEILGTINLAVDAGGNHYFVELETASLEDCGFRQGYIYQPHWDRPQSYRSEADFVRVMKHILTWEGGCSDHPNDPGGRTYMGITTERARLNGWYSDVCAMPESRVLEIYKDDYWLTRPHRYPWPLNLAVMNTEVNSGGGRAQIFIDRMERDVPNDSVSEKASWFVDQQTAFYYAIANNNSKLRVFLRGWLNRSNYMQDVIAGVISLNGHDLEDEEGSAKAYEGGSEE